MKKSYDKIIFIIALLLFLGSSGYYFTQESSGVDPSLKTKAPQGEMFKVIDIPVFEETKIIWENPIAQDEAGNELFEIFTPPKIYWDESNNVFDFEPPRPPIEKAPFGLALLSIERELYRIQIDSFFGAPGGDYTKAKVQFYDLESDRTVRGIPGDDISSSDFSIVSCKLVREEDEDQMIRSIPIIVIHDKRLKKNITLRAEEGKKHYIEGKYLLSFKTEDPPYSEKMFNLKKAGDTYSIQEDKFTLLDFNFDKMTATLEKKSLVLEEPEVKELKISAPMPSATPLDSSDSPTEELNDLPENFNLF